MTNHFITHVIKPLRGVCTYKTIFPTQTNCFGAPCEFRWPERTQISCIVEAPGSGPIALDEFQTIPHSLFYLLTHSLFYLRTKPGHIRGVLTYMHHHASSSPRQRDNYVLTCRSATNRNGCVQKSRIAILSGSCWYRPRRGNRSCQVMRTYQRTR